MSWQLSYMLTGEQHVLVTLVLRWIPREADSISGAWRPSKLGASDVPQVGWALCCHSEHRTQVCIPMASDTAAWASVRSFTYDDKICCLRALSAFKYTHRYMHTQHANTEKHTLTHRDMYAHRYTHKAH